ncbi:MAG: phosphohistidine phosphatase SixA [Pseudomonadota bacterium]
MELILIRHGQAGDADDWLSSTGRSDDERPLTDEGGKRLRRAFRGLRRILETPDQVFVSPLQRAQQTAELMREAYLDLPLHTIPTLRPEDAPQDTLEWLRAHAKPGQRIALVGHEPHLSALLALLTLGESCTGALPLKKGGVAIVYLDELRAGCGELQAMLPPRVLRALG